MTTVTISLPDSLKEFIEHEVQTKGYGNVSEYLRGLLRDAQKRERESKLEALLLEGLASGEDRPLTADFWRELRKDTNKILKAHASSRRRRKTR